jgi:hypothetical protein
MSCILCKKCSFTGHRLICSQHLDTIMQSVILVSRMHIRQWGQCTTRITFFAECLRHSAKAILHSAKPLPSVTLGKAFAECNTRQRTLGKNFIGKGFFAECFFSDTRQRLCRVSKSTRQRKTLGKLKIEKN